MWRLKEKEKSRKIWPTTWQHEESQAQNKSMQPWGRPDQAYLEGRVVCIRVFVLIFFIVKHALEASLS